MHNAFSTLAGLAGLLIMTVPGPATAADWTEYRIAENGITVPEDPEAFTLVDISGDASVVAGNEVADRNLFPEHGPAQYRHQYPFYWKDGMGQLREIAPNTDEHIEFIWGYRGRVTAVSRDGRWVVGEYARAGEHTYHQAFVYSVEDDIFEYLGDFGWSAVGAGFSSKDPAVYYLASEATGISGDGSIVVGWARDIHGRPKAFRWTREEGLVKVFDWINIWDDQREDRFLAISDDGTRVAGDESYLRKPNEADRAYRAFYMDSFTMAGELPIPNRFSLREISAIGGPGNSILGTILSEIEDPVEAGWLTHTYESAGIRWFPERDNYEVYPQFRYWKRLSLSAQTGDGNLMTLLMTGIAPTDGPADYGLLWMPETGLMEATGYLADRFEVDFGNGAVSRALPSDDGNVLVAEIYTTSAHSRKALARFDLEASPAPMSLLFPKASYSNGWRDTLMGRFYSRDYPYLWWEHFGWLYLHEQSSSSSQIRFWHPDLGWCFYPLQPGTHRYYIYAFDPGEWLYVIARQGWLNSPSRGWLRLL
jgi:probable HAF family extracellular repeat protein